MAASVHLELDLLPGTDPICGVLSTAGRPPLAFSGWVEFLGLLERLRAPDGETDEHRTAAI